MLGGRRGAHLNLHAGGEAGGALEPTCWGEAGGVLEPSFITAALLCIIIVEEISNFVVNNFYVSFEAQYCIVCS